MTTLDLNLALGPSFEIAIASTIPPIGLTIVNNSGPTINAVQETPLGVTIDPTPGFQITVQPTGNTDDDITLNLNPVTEIGIAIQQNVPPSYDITVSQPQNFQLVAGIASSNVGGGGSTTGTIDLSVTAQVFLDGYRAVQIDGLYVQPNEDSLSRYAGVTREPINTGNVGTVVKEGLITNNGWSWTNGLPIFVQANGVLTQTLPTHPWRRIGYAVSPTQINLDPFPFLELSSNNW
jgi:hypothetical protein